MPGHRPQNEHLSSIFIVILPYMFLCFCSLLAYVIDDDESRVTWIISSLPFLRFYANLAIAEDTAC